MSETNTISLDKLLQNITPLPWKQGGYGGIYPAGNNCPLIAHAETKSGKCGDNWKANELFMAHAANVLPVSLNKMKSVAENLERVALVQDRSVNIIKQAIRMQAKELREEIARAEKIAI